MSTCSAVIVPSCDSRATASCTWRRGIRRTRSAAPDLPAADACTEVEWPPSAVVIAERLVDRVRDGDRRRDAQPRSQAP